MQYNAPKSTTYIITMFLGLSIQVRTCRQSYGSPPARYRLIMILVVMLLLILLATSVSIAIGIAMLLLLLVLLHCS